MGPAFWQPTIFSDSVCFERLCVGFCVSWSLVWCACVHVLFPTTTSALNCIKPGGLFINTRFVYRHCISVYRAFSVFSLLDVLVVCYVHYMIGLTRAAGCVFVRIHFKVVMLRGSGGGGGGAEVLARPPPSPPLTPHLTANLAH